MAILCTASSVRSARSVQSPRVRDDWGDDERNNDRDDDTNDWWDDERDDWSDDEGRVKSPVNV